MASRVSPCYACPRRRLTLLSPFRYHRDGVAPDSAEALALGKAAAAADGVDLFGVYTHGGHSYDARTPAAIEAIAAAERDAVVALAERLRAATGQAVPHVSVGSTPTCSRPPPDGLAGVTEMHPGNYVFYDAAQAEIGACGLEDVAIRVLTRVVGHYPSSNTLLVDLGWTGVTSQRGDDIGYGRFRGAPELRVVNFKQEAGVLSTENGTPLDFDKYPVGSLLQLLPYHSCAAAHNHKELYVVDGNDEVVDVWPRVRGW